jgi:hypothetical protein
VFVNHFTISSGRLPDMEIQHCQSITVKRSGLVSEDTFKSLFRGREDESSVVFQFDQQVVEGVLFDTMVLFFQAKLATAEIHQIQFHESVIFTRAGSSAVLEGDEDAITAEEYAKKSAELLGDTSSDLSATFRFPSQSYQAVVALPIREGLGDTAFAQVQGLRLMVRPDKIPGGGRSATVVIEAGEEEALHVAPAVRGLPNVNWQDLESTARLIAPLAEAAVAIRPGGTA